ncbi:FIST signal transduction protein [Shewanella sp.]|uniref:FIST signal transduction protein n=1 Tax=Shewanella sp. TaxID=50422 RepID=UPI0035653225
MKSVQTHWDGEAWSPCDLTGFNQDNTLVLIFGDLPNSIAPVQMLRTQLPLAQFAGCTTAGEISNKGATDDMLVATIVAFEQSQIKLASTQVSHREDSRAAGRCLADALNDEGLQYIMVISDGMTVNGSELTRELVAVHPGIPVTGGLAGDGARFNKTYTLANDKLATHQVVAIGFYGSHLTVSYGSRGGWIPFGPIRKVTDAEANVLKELDHESALTVYRRYLGELAGELPAAGLRYPLEIMEDGRSTTVVRTLLSINEQDGSVVFAGDIPKGASARLMRANAECLIDGANQAAIACQQGCKQGVELVILVSCIGRRLLLRQLTDEEIDEVTTVLGEDVMVCGYYSYGEIAPFEIGDCAELHNQTMTVTSLSERLDDAPTA